MNDTVSDLRVGRREAHIASAGRIHSAKCVHTVAGSSRVPYRSVCAPAGFARESDTSAPAISLWRLSLAGIATDRQEVLAYLLLVVGAAVSLLNGFGRLDDLLVNWASFVELMQRVFS